MLDASTEYNTSGYSSEKHMHSKGVVRVSGQGGMLHLSNMTALAVGLPLPTFQC